MSRKGRDYAIVLCPESAVLGTHNQSNNRTNCKDQHNIETLSTGKLC